MTGQQITTAAELDALPVGSVIRCDDAEGIGLNVAERHAGGWQYVGSALYFSSAQVASDEMAFTVLYRPDEPQRVQPSRERLTLIARDVHLYDHGPDAAISGPHAQRIADAVLALLPGRTEAEVKAEALPVIDTKLLDGLRAAETRLRFIQHHWPADTCAEVLVLLESLTADRLEAEARHG